MPANSIRTRARSARSAPLALLATTALIFLSAACDKGAGQQPGAGGDGASGSVRPGASAPPATTPPQAAFSIRVDDLVGSKGLMLVGSVFKDPGNGSWGEQIGTACAAVDADPWSGGGEVSSAPADNPCEKSAPFGQVVLPAAGSYRFRIGVYQPGTKEPLRCATGSMNGDKPVAIRLPATSLTSNCPPT